MKIQPAPETIIYCKCGAWDLTRHSAVRIVFIRGHGKHGKPETANVENCIVIMEESE